MIPTGTLSVAYSIIQAGKYKILKAKGDGKLPVGTVVLCNKGRSKMERCACFSVPMKPQSNQPTPPSSDSRSMTQARIKAYVAGMQGNCVPCDIGQFEGKYMSMSMVELMPNLQW